MFKRALIAMAAASVLAVTISPGMAQQTPPAPAVKQAPRAYGYQMMTPAERDEYRKKMQEAKTPEERAKLTAEHRALMLKRAEEEGVTLQGRAGTPRAYGYQLMTPQERQAYMDKMHAASTPEERIKLRDEHRAEMRKRAQDKGVTLPEPRGPGAGLGPRGPGAGPGPGGGPGPRP